VPADTTPAGPGYDRLPRRRRGHGRVGRAAAARAGQRRHRRDLAGTRDGGLGHPQGGPPADRGDQGPLTAIVGAAERTLCHLDVWPANLIDQDGTSVLLDWSFTGDGAVGEDAANLIIDSCADGLMDVALLPEIAASATDGYLRGLRDGGWTGSADTVRTTIAACGAAKYSWFAPAIAGRAARDHIGQSSYGQDSSAAEAAHRVTALVTLIADWAEAGQG